MEFEITLIARSTDEGGMSESFKSQLAEIGGEAELLRQVAPYRVESSDGRHFEAQQTYRITL